MCHAHISRKSFIHLESDSQSTPKRSSTGSAKNHSSTRVLSRFRAPASSDGESCGNARLPTCFLELGFEGQTEEEGAGLTLALVLFLGMFVFAR